MGISLRGTIATAAVGALAVTALTGAGLAHAATKAPAPAAAPAAAAAGGYQFVEIGSHKDRTFNQLLGINNKGQIAGYFGSGAAGHPNKGYEISAPYAQNDFQSENFPRSAQTQITGLNDDGVEVGFFSTQNKANLSDNNFGFWRSNGKYHEVNYPTKNHSAPPVNQLLGINDTGTAVGFYNDSAGNSHGYAYNIKTGKFKLVGLAGATSLTATAVNNHGAVAGFFTGSGGAVDGFLKLHSGKEYRFAVPGATMTQAFGVNDNDWVVGTYTEKSGATHGFIYIAGGRLITGIDDPNGAGTTLLNGINNENDIVGFYTDSAGNTDGLVAYPAF
ncbi:MAG: hypothetical protein ABSA02_40640 [Trebonia sp.]|jgi:hypothetical protein